MGGMDDREIELGFENQRARIGVWGASLRGYDCDGVEIAWGYHGKASKKGGQGDVLAPWPGRVENGYYEFEGIQFQLEKTDKDGPNAIHGFVRNQLWRVITESPASVELGFELPASHYANRGYDFSLELKVRYELSAQGLKCSFEMKNVGVRPAPVGIGFHPYFTLGAATANQLELFLPSSQSIEFKNLIPTGRVLPTAGSEVDFSTLRKVGAVEINHCLMTLKRDSDGLARARIRNPENGLEMALWMDQAFDYIVVYTGDAIPAPGSRRALAVEPMTCGTDAFNRPEWGLKTLKPGDSFRGSFGFQLNRSP